MVLFGLDVEVKTNRFAFFFPPGPTSFVIRPSGISGHPQKKRVLFPFESECSLETFGIFCSYPVTFAAKAQLRFSYFFSWTTGRCLLAQAFRSAISGFSAVSLVFICCGFK